MTAPPLLLLVHGWGLDASFWDPLRAHLDGIDCVAWDLGFRRRPARPLPPAGRPVIAVGHSFGVLWLLRHRPLAWRQLVSINGFARFAQAADLPTGVPARLIQRMLARLASEPRRVHEDFLRRCGVDKIPLGPVDATALADGLAALLDWDERGQPVDLVLAGRSDAILPPGLTESVFAGAAVDWHSGGHLLPWEEPAWCADRLRRLVETAS